ncbi:MAG: hypothetical protein OJF49_000628 [Ktedonobacterales bacterium]|nr:MAG: hypothetical protein OJF49_000628 [Ktedonobacterales bacterium]
MRSLPGRRSTLSRQPSAAICWRLRLLSDELLADSGVARV